MSRAWSYSAYGVYKQCPLKYKLTKIDKLPEPKGPALERGIEIHAKAEKFLKNGGPIPRELSLFRDDFKWLYERGAAPEERWGFTSQWTPIGFFAKNVWLRLVVDTIVINTQGTHALIVDFKTGKMRPGYDEQLELYVSAAFKFFPALETISTELWYLDSGDCIGRDSEYTPKDADKFRKEWIKRIKPMQNDTRFDAKPNEWCRYCHFRKSNGGPCKI